VAGAIRSGETGAGARLTASGSVAPRDDDALVVSTRVPDFYRRCVEVTSDVTRDFVDERVIATTPNFRRLPARVRRG
jgi:hypothetical protein